MSSPGPSFFEVEVPPAPRLALRVGVTGHRAPRLAAADPELLRLRVRDALLAIAAAVAEIESRPDSPYARRAPLLRVVSALADGADQIVAAEALSLGWALQAPLPFAREEYRRDFDEVGRASFDQLLGRASVVLELDGDRAEAGAAYHEVGLAMLRQSDVVVAVWDGLPESGRGGTAQIVRDARERELPVVWVEAAAPHEVRFLPADLPAGESRPLADIGIALAAALLPLSSGEGDALAYGHAEPRATPLGIYRSFRDTLVGDHATDPAPSAPNDAAPADAGIAVPEVDREYETADMLADHYAAWFRDSFVTNYLLSALAVVVGVMGFAHWLWTAIELVLILVIVAVTAYGRSRRWHARWLSYRLLAEQLRQFRLLWPLGRAPRPFRAAAHAVDGDPSRLWVTWRYRARTREAGMVSAHLTPAYVERCRHVLVAELARQARYHERTSRVAHALHSRLHLAGISLFALTGAVCVAHLCRHLLAAGHEPPGGDPWNGPLTLFAASFPAFGAALAGIVGTGEFFRVETRSRAMHGRLTALGRRLAAASPDARACGDLAEEAADVMISELVDWQLTFRARSLELPA